MAEETLTNEISRRSGWGVFLGILTAAIGVVMILYPYAAAVASTLFVGWALIFAGVAQFVFAISSQTPGSFFLKLLFGVLYGIAGIALIAFPTTGVSTLTIILGTMLVFEAVLEAAMGFALPAGSTRGWFLVSGIASLALGLLILFGWPASSGWAIGTFVGVAVLFNGITRAAISRTIHRETRKLDRAVRAAERV